MFTNFGLAPYFKQLILARVATQRLYVFLFDESLNHYLQTEQLDIHVRIRDEVKDKYIGSEFLGHSAAKDVVENVVSPHRNCHSSKQKPTKGSYKYLTHINKSKGKKYFTKGRILLLHRPNNQIFSHRRNTHVFK